MGEGGGVEDAFLDGAAERGAVGVLGAEVGVPGVQVGVEVEQGDRAVLLGHGAQQGQRDGVVAAEGHQAGAGVQEVVSGGLDGLDGLVDVEGVGGDVAGVRDLGEGEGGRVLGRVVRAQQAGRLTDGVAAEAGAGAVGDAGVEGDADHRDVGRAHLVEAGQAGEGRRARVAGDAGGVDGADGFLGGAGGGGCGGHEAEGRERGPACPWTFVVMCRRSMDITSIGGCFKGQ